MKRSVLLACGVFALLASSASADVKVPSVFASHMVVQRDQPVVVWGTADKGESITVSFAGKDATAKAGDDGKWKVTLPKVAANAKGQKMTIKGNNTLELEDVLVGDVWIGSGQSNMEMQLASTDKSKQAIDEAKHANIRLLHVKKVSKNEPQKDVVLENNGAWSACTPTTARNFSAVLYYFGVRLQKDLDVPIGLINSSWGGSAIQPWTPGEKANGGMYNAMIAPLAPVAIKGVIWYQGESNMGEGMVYRDRTEALVKGWRKAFGQADLPFYFVQIAPFSGYNPMVTLTPATKGAKIEGGKLRVPLAGQKIDYKDGKLANKFEIAGEKGTKGPKYVPAEATVEKDELVISGKNVEKPISARYSTDLLPAFWEAQTACLKIPHTGMAVTTDITENVGDIHPRNKLDVGNRLTLWALAKAYGKKDVVYSGPLYKSMKVDGDKIRLSFAHVGGGLKSRDGKALSEFEIAGEDGKFYTAKATIDGEAVVVSAKDVEKPTQARFGWRKIANPNLSNKEGLPAGPFRTKDWKGGTGE